MPKPFSQSTSKSDLRRAICAFAKTQGIARIYFNSNGIDRAGSYRADTNCIWLNNNLSNYQLLVAFFHELGHAELAKNNLYLPYHLDAKTELYTIKQKFAIENIVEHIAKKLWNKYVNIKVYGQYTFYYTKKRMKSAHLYMI